jgi:hypothetical protein
MISMRCTSPALSLSCVCYLVKGCGEEKILISSVKSFWPERPLSRQVSQEPDSTPSSATDSCQRLYPFAPTAALAARSAPSPREYVSSATHDANGGRVNRLQSSWDFPEIFRRDSVIITMAGVGSIPLRRGECLASTGLNRRILVSQSFTVMPMKLSKTVTVSLDLDYEFAL